MAKNDILEGIKIEKLIYGGSGLATAPDGRRIIISGGAIPESIVDLRITRAKKHHLEAQIIRTVKRSLLEQDLPPRWQVYGGCKWLPIPYAKQLEIKETQVKEAFHHLKEYTEDTVFHPITPSPEQVGYRNKVEFSWGKYISDREGVYDDFRFGFHAPAQFDRIIDCTYCVLADEEINAIFAKIDTLSRASGLPTYDPKTQVGFWRHLVVRKARKTEEIMLVFSVNGVWSPPQLGEDGRGNVKNTSPKPSYEERSVEEIFENMIQALTNEFPHIASIYFLENTGKADIVDGRPLLLFGKSAITEELLGKKFEIQPKSFFQTNSLGAERLYSIVAGFLSDKNQQNPSIPPSQGGILLDLYGGTGTIGLILSHRFKQVYSVELVKSASEDGKENAKRNNVNNIEFINEKTEDFLKQYKTEYLSCTKNISDHDFSFILNMVNNQEFNQKNIQKNQYAVIRDEGKIIGFGRIIPLEHNQYELSNLWIDEAYQGKKLGYKIARFLYKDIPLGGELFIKNDVKLNQYYEELGFQVTTDFPEIFYETLDWARDKGIPYNVMQLVNLEKIIENDPSTSSVIVVDPPRDGMHPNACEDILKFQAERIIYVSCNPATLVRDLTILLSTGAYTLTDVAPMDMFPHTHHIETVVKLVRKG